MSEDLYATMLPCQAQEWQRDGRGRWAMRVCINTVQAAHQHIWAPWAYDVPSPVAKAERERDDLRALLRNENVEDAVRLRTSDTNDEAEQSALLDWLALREAILKEQP